MIKEKLFGTTSKGEEVKEYILTNGTVEVSIINFGGAVRCIKLADKKVVTNKVVKIGLRTFLRTFSDRGYKSSFLSGFVKCVRFRIPARSL